MTETKGDYYPRMNALLQEEEIQRLQVKVNMLEAENAELKEKLAQYEQGQPMLYSPKDGTVILVEIDEEETSYFDIVHWDSESLLWVGNFKNYRVFYSIDEKITSLPKRWWPLPGWSK